MNSMTPTLVTTCTPLPPEGARALWGGPAALTPLFDDGFAHD